MRWFSVLTWYVYNIFQRNKAYNKRSIKINIYHFILIQWLSLVWSCSHHRGWYVMITVTCWGVRSRHRGVPGTSGTHRLRSRFAGEISFLLVSGSHVGKHAEHGVTDLVSLQYQPVNKPGSTPRTGEIRLNKIKEPRVFHFNEASSNSFIVKYVRENSRFFVQG